ncbi:MAG: barstar family protein [Candidatus Nanopelagicales bacterium]
MSGPEVMVLDTRGARDKQAFLRACALSLAFPDYFGHNWDAFEESLGEFVAQHPRVLVAWTGASDLRAGDRKLALEIMDRCFADGADLLIIDAVLDSPAPDFALDHVQVAIPEGSEQDARAYWVDLVGLSEVARPTESTARSGLWLSGDALNLHLGVDPDFRPARMAHPAIMVRDYEALADRLAAAGQFIEQTGDTIDQQRFHTNDPFGNRIEFIAF